MNKFLKNNRSFNYFFYKFCKQITPIFFYRKIFSFSKDYRSDSEENIHYLPSIKKMLGNEKKFLNFKRNIAYRDILEHVTRSQGLEYLNILKKRNDGMLNEGLKTILLSDQIGNPIRYNYEGFSTPLSPTTLRYLKVASDIKILFGSKIRAVAEIGCGYGGQALVNDQLLKIHIAKLFDLPIVNKLIQRYLNFHLFNGAYVTTTINNEVPNKYDLVISNYAFSELPKKLQIQYIKKVLSHSKKGYLTMNSGLNEKFNSKKLTLKELYKLLPNFNIFEEEPLTSPDNYIIAWGYNKRNTRKYFKLKY